MQKNPLLLRWNESNRKFIVIIVPRYEPLLHNGNSITTS